MPVIAALAIGAFLIWLNITLGMKSYQKGRKSAAYMLFFLALIFIVLCIYYIVSL